MLEYVSVVSSTNDVLCRRIAENIPLLDGHWLIADRQTSGRGRLGRVWNDGKGNFMGSCAVQIFRDSPAAHTLALVAGIALFDSVSQFHSEDRGLYLKWPNDLLSVKGKVAGILLERVKDMIIVGFGINLVHAPMIEGRSTTSLNALDISIDRDTFAQTLARIFYMWLERWRVEGLEIIIQEWMGRAYPLGIELEIGEKGATDYLTGVFTGLDEFGALQLRDKNGTNHAIMAGDVQICAAAKQI